jgi:hypothetical protein
VKYLDELKGTFRFALIGELLDTVLKDTDALLFDMRSNGGGLMHESHYIIQLFKADVAMIQDQVIDNEHTREIRAQGGFKFKPSTLYSKRINLMENNTYQYGMHYVKPVGVFTDGLCKSSIVFDDNATPIFNFPTIRCLILRSICSYYAR